MYEKDKQLWAQFASAAIAGRAAQSSDYLPNEIVEDAYEIADRMLSKFHEKFEGC